MMHTLLLGLTVALLWGSADTLATGATKRIGSATTTFVAQIAGFLLVAAFGLTVAGRLGAEQQMAGKQVEAALLFTHCVQNP